MFQKFCQVLVFAGAISLTPRGERGRPFQPVLATDL